MASKDLLSLSSYQYDLPPHLIAQYPCTPRDASRLMVVERKSGHISEIVFKELIDFLAEGDTLIFNDTKVVPARLFGTRKGGGAAEILLVRCHPDGTWDAMAKPGRRLPVGSQITFGDDLSGQVVAVFEDGSRRIQFKYEGDFPPLLEKYGKMPLPLYIRKGVGEEVDKERYQTVYAAQPGAIAAPTAGLHFTKDLLDALTNKEISQAHLTLHVGLGTFKTVKTENITEYQMHAEQVHISPETAQILNERRGDSRQICVGTTCCRALESAADVVGHIVPGDYSTSIFIYPGYQFKFVRQLLTNFHLPGSTLLMLVSAFAGYELIQEAYAKAIERQFRFFSYGDAMLII